VGGDCIPDYCSEKRLSGRNYFIGEAHGQAGRKRPPYSTNFAGERIKKMEQNGIITGYTTNIDAGKLGKHLTAFISVTLESGSRYADDEAIVDLLRQEPQIEECHIVAGEESFILKVRVSTPLELQELTTRLRKIEGIANTRTTVALSTPLDRPTAIE
jgi:Lrp/AsnC family transcriptional regulator, leucine-responsive regulatory protein